MHPTIVRPPTIGDWTKQSVAERRRLLIDRPPVDVAPTRGRNVLERPLGRKVASLQGNAPALSMLHAYPID